MLSYLLMSKLYIGNDSRIICRVNVTKNWLALNYNKVQPKIHHDIMSISFWSCVNTKFGNERGAIQAFEEKNISRTSLNVYIYQKYKVDYFYKSNTFFYCIYKKWHTQQDTVLKIVLKTTQLDIWVYCL